MAANRVKLRLDVRALQTDLVRADRIVPIASLAEVEILVLRHLLRSYANDYNQTRTHLSLNKDSPVTRPIEAVGRILPVPILGGLHHQYIRI